MKGNKKHGREMKVICGIYVHKVVYRILSDIDFFSKAISMMTYFVSSVYERISAEASSWSHCNRRCAISL